jgi:glucose-6-phosphate 1-epimerase
MEYWRVESARGNGGLETVVITSVDNGDPSYAPHSAEVYLHGATLTSWVHRGAEKIFVSPNAIWNGVKAIRGGIPVVFPQFGQPNLSMPQHGFARTKTWTVESSSSNEEGARLILTLSQDHETLALWPHPFHLRYQIELTRTNLFCSFEIENTSESDAFSCQCLLHTYFKVDDIRSIQVEGFGNLSFKDKTRANEIFVDETVSRSIDGEVDRVYIETEPGLIPDIIITDNSTPKLRVKKEGVLVSKEGDGKRLATDVVLWNPWIEKSIALPDMSDDGYLSFLCIEPGLVADFVSVPPQQKLILSHRLVPL